MSDDEACEFTINKDYADKYNTWRQKEELQRLKTKYGDVELQAGSEESSSSESEDDDATGLTAQVEKDWLRTLAALKAKDPRIYDKQAKFYHSDESESSSDSSEEEKSKKKEKPMYLKDYERKVILEKGGVVSESEDEEDAAYASHKAGYYEEQEEIRKSLTVASAEVDSDSDDGFLTRRKKSKRDQAKEEGEYMEWLKGRKDVIEHDKNVQQDLAPLKEMWSDPKLDDGEKFLRDYILNKRYKEDDDDRLPTYDEIIQDEDLSEDEELVEKQETFERKYNFRFEEPDQEFIKAYPRTVGDSLRRSDDRRTKKRQEVKERKEKEKVKKREEMKTLKNLKRKEIMAKIDQLKEITGNEDIGITEGDIEEDFDPSKYDQMMKKAFDIDYYDGDELEKPEFSYDEELDDENWDEWTGPGSGQGGEPVAGPSGVQADYEPHCDDPDFNMDADYDPHAKDRSHGLMGQYGKKRRKSKFKQAVEANKPVFDPNEKTFEEYFDEYYKLDYEDMIGDQPCRFRYRPVPANDYGLSTEEILTCSDKELNQWASLKKMSQHQTQEEEHYERRIYTKKARNRAKKLNILTSLREEKDEDDEEERDDAEINSHGQPSQNVGKKAKKGKKKKKKANNSQTTTQNEEKQIVSGKPKFAEGSKVTGKKRKNEYNADDSGKKKKILDQSETEQDVKDQDDSVTNERTPNSPNQPTESKKRPKDKKLNKKKKQKPGTMSDERLKAFGINPKKFKFTHLPKIKEQRKKEKIKQNVKS